MSYHVNYVGECYSSHSHGICGIQIIYDTTCAGENMSFPICLYNMKIGKAIQYQNILPLPQKIKFQIRFLFSLVPHTLHQAEKRIDIRYPKTPTIPTLRHRYAIIAESTAKALQTPGSTLHLIIQARNISHFIFLFRSL